MGFLSPLNSSTNLTGPKWLGFHMWFDMLLFLQVCCICLAKYANNDELRELPCSHFFHKECVDKWLKINALCPLCKGEVGESILSSLSAAASLQREETQWRLSIQTRDLSFGFIFRTATQKSTLSVLFQCSSRLQVLQLIIQRQRCCYQPL